jgi:ATP-binding cassette subfamily F protein 3
MLIEPSNFLILDEPTNHLDMRSKEVLMNALQKYNGTVLIVSHDREFIDGIVDKVIEVKNKKIRTYIGNATDYIRAKEQEAKLLNPKNKKPDQENKKSDAKAVNGTATSAEQVKKKKDISRQIQPVKNRISELEKQTGNHEKKLKELEEMMGKDEFYKGAYDIVKITNEYNSLKDTLKTVYSEWEQETEKLNSLEKQLN